MLFAARRGVHGLLAMVVSQKHSFCNLEISQSQWNLDTLTDSWMLSIRMYSLWLNPLQLGGYLWGLPPLCIYLADVISCMADPAQTCHLNSIAIPGSGSLTAQKRLTKSELSGFVFVNCLVTGSGPIYLGRAWGPYSRVVFLLTQINAPIIPAGWFDWGIPARDK